MGYPLGSRFTFHDRIVAYCDALDAASPKVKSFRYGQSVEGRPLAGVFVSSPENLARLDQLRQAHLSSLGLANQTQENPPLILWLGYNIHGDEASASEAALMTLHHLTTDTAAERWLRETIVVLLPCLNPDGRARYVQHFTQWQSALLNTDIQSAEHRPAFQPGRFNHYLFDLNRDWLWQVQPESRARAALYQQWMPHVAVDFHEMDHQSSYFFPPSAEPIHAAVTAWQLAFQDSVSKNHIRYFDQRGWRYYTRQVFDLFYPSYGDSWTTLKGAIGMTYEQGGGRKAGIALQLDNGSLLTLSDRLLHHHTTAVSTLEAAHRHRSSLQTQLQRYFKQPPQLPGKYRSFVVSGENPTGKLLRFQALLQREGILFGHPRVPQKSIRGFAYQNASQETFDLQAGDWLITCDQPQGRLVSVLFEPEPTLNDSLTYDLTAWALPYALGLKAYATTAALSVSPDTVAIPSPKRLPDPYAYLLPWRTLEDARTLVALLKDGWQVRMAHRPFVHQGQAWESGTLVVFKGEQSTARQAQFASFIAPHLAESYGHTPIATAINASGNDLGDQTYKPLRLPRVGILVGEGIEIPRIGELWYLLEQELSLPVSLLFKDNIKDISLSAYDVLLLPSGDYADVASSLYDYFSHPNSKIITFGKSLGTFERLPGLDLVRLDLSRSAATFAQTKRSKLSARTAGSIVAIHLDPTHPLSFGYGSRYFSLKHESLLYQRFLPETNHWNVGSYASVQSGFMGQQLRAALPGATALSVGQIKAGKLIYFADSPAFRGFWDHGKLLLANAIFF